MMCCITRIFVLHMIMGLCFMYGSNPKPVQQPIHPTLLAPKPVVLFTDHKQLTILPSNDEFKNIHLGSPINKKPLKIPQKKPPLCEGFCSIQ